MTFTNILAKVRFLTKTNSTSFTSADIAILANNAMERLTSLIFQADGRWQFDDSNQPATDQGDGTGGLPIATTSLVSGQQDYRFAVTHLGVERVEVLDSAGNWTLLQPIDQRDVDNQAISDFYSTNGAPIYYDKIGNSILLYPAPNYSLAASLKIYFTRPPTYFTSSDTTKTPGINALYHDLIALWPAYEYAIANGLPNADRIKVEIQEKEDALKEDYTLRSQDEHLNLSSKGRKDTFR